MMQTSAHANALRDDRCYGDHTHGLEGRKEA